MIYVQIDNDYSPPEFRFDTWEEVEQFVRMCFKNGFGVKMYEVKEKELV